ncbi:uncharacterized protein LOC121877896 [Homarus americanus]|uniref:uncharacterized protein LOC121877896 n=1 Tax=Homarus americanus TaxID=6706 RepID=UPI001C48A056|nr:uncharacterized protein LOC121877896 [Homarus americanus]
MASQPLVLLLLASSPLFTGGEVAEVCSEEELSFACDGGSQGRQELVIKEAWLYGAAYMTKEDLGQGEQCHVQSYNLQYKKGSFLQYINKKCGGQTECKFNIQSDVPSAHEDVWKNTVLWTVYHCVQKSDFHRVCGTEKHAQSGWMQSIGYPQYYLGEPGVCTVTIRVDEGQHIQLTITDLSLRDIIQPNEESCRDSVTVTEGSKQLLQKCGETNKPLKIKSEGPELNVTLTATSNVYPKRGYIGYFQAIGCETPATPVDGYMAYRNATHAEYWCCVRHVFPDTHARRRLLKCNRAHTWNDTLPDCADLEELFQDGNITETQYQNMVNGSSGYAMAEMLRQAHLVYDLVVPTVIMSVLVLGNVAIVFLIIYCRRGVIEEGANCEELESIKANPEPTDVVDSKPCEV